MLSSPENKGKRVTSKHIKLYNSAKQNIQEKLYIIFKDIKILTIADFSGNRILNTQYLQMSEESSNQSEIQYQEDGGEKFSFLW